MALAAPNVRRQIAQQGKMKGVAIIEAPKTNQTPTEDPQYPAAVERVKAAARELQDSGIVDSEGRRIRKDLPLDMQDSEDRDFGG